ncbi:hypothetical protein [Micromonospora sp. L32]|uniref:hypothetical protein n=1 Tax=Micromonospora sp. L32 TaxID=3452214 RepID=UPI003F8A58B0
MSDVPGENLPEPWFAERSGVVLLYRINRRPLPEPSLFAHQPELFMDHLVEVLQFGVPEVTGRRNKREWRLGNREITPDEDALFGQIGWVRTDYRAADHYNEAEMRWEDIVEGREVSARAPFVIDGGSRILGVLQHPSFAPTTVAKVFENLLRRGEEAREAASTEWSVEPILDEQDFLSWLRSVDSVQRIMMVAKLPNPDALPEFEPVWDRMQQRKARLLKEIMEAANVEVGLQDLEEDAQVRAFLAMGTNAFGYVVADGRRGRHDTRYDQRERSAHERTDELPSNWMQVLGIMLGMIRDRRRQ